MNISVHIFTVTSMSDLSKDAWRLQRV